MPFLKFVVYGKVQPRGSKTSFPLVNRKTGQPVRGKGGRIVTVTKDSNANSGEWMQAVAKAARCAMQHEGIEGLIEGPLEVWLTFVSARPMGDFSKKGGVKPRANSYPVVRPDCLKLARAIEDSMNKVVYRDDSQIVTEHICKRYGDVPGVLVEIASLPAEHGEFSADHNGLGQRDLSSQEVEGHAA